MSVVSYHTVGGLLLGETPPSGVRLDYLADALGSVVATADESALVRNEYRYAPYGRETARLGPDPDPAFLWTGESGSRSSGAAHAGGYNRARHYARETGRWTSVDPLWPGESAYGYVGGNPASRVDPYGRQVRRCPIHGGEPGCVFSGPPGSESDPAYWHCQKEIPPRLETCPGCLKTVKDQIADEYPKGFGVQNAMRHCVGACVAAKQCGGLCAGLINLHEVWPKFDWPSKDSRRDRHNNEIGLGLNQKNPKGDCHAMCAREYHLGHLW